MGNELILNCMNKANIFLIYPSKSLLFIPKSKQSEPKTIFFIFKGLKDDLFTIHIKFLHLFIHT